MAILVSEMTAYSMMLFDNELIEARLIKRSKRFLAEVCLPDGAIVTAHCPNPGAMTGLCDPHSKIWIKNVRAKHRKLEWRWMLSQDNNGAMVGIDTMAANQLAREAMMNKSLPIFKDMTLHKKEPAASENTRLDFLLKDKKGEFLYVEVKSVTLAQEEGGQRVALFPDAVTKRGAKHMAMLEKLVRQGYRAMVLFIIQREDCTLMRPHEKIDLHYADALRKAIHQGVESYALSCRVSAREISCARETKISLTHQE